ncbi:ribonuclease P protein component [Candidatus Saccharibacteria bacterium RIFCSPHIGHO2_12_FULL_49_19]|nr:MAG: ribonuclease P protein component [Candidatus Saccharibacteria bacterium RIFCSPLOWO2_01_FULL_49_22]OGL37189.1 MAG: ribonuclease P protein component [Candidatus Saccharibacteria bacterium RIFCSPHIGHO2_12_FULL_49_19]
MLSKFHRFHGNRTLRRVYAQGKSVRGPLFSVRYAPSNRDSYRVAVVVSRKVRKSAVGRNRIRRRVYGAVRNLGLSRPFDIVITIFSDSLLDVPAEDLARQLKRQLKVAGVLS